MEKNTPSILHDPIFESFMNDYKVNKIGLADDDKICLYLLNLLENQPVDPYYIPAVQLDDIRKYKIKRDRDKRILARSFLFELLYRQYGISDFEFRFNEYQRPFLRSDPTWCFSFSYANNYVLIGLSKNKKIGVDIEYINSAIEINEIAPEIMCASELEKFNSYRHEPEERYNYFFQLFSAKESIIKAFGTGLYFDVTSINTLDGDQFIYKNAGYTCSKLGLWKEQYSLAICSEQ